jgi:hypothetical protein
MSTTRGDASWSVTVEIIRHVVTVGFDPRRHTVTTHDEQQPMKGRSADGTADSFEMLKRTPRTCHCPTCSLSEAFNAIREGLSAADKATDAWLNRSMDEEGTLHYLLDEIATIAQSPLAFGVRKRLRKAIRIAK